MIDTIYHGLMRKTLEDQYWDTFILSKGHGSMALYVVLEHLGIMPSEEIEKYCTREGHLGMHPDRGTPGIVTSTGSLGHGFGMGAGMALYEKVFKEDRMIYVVMSDGELQEGSVWEIFLQAPALGLTSLVGFVDNNNLQSMDFTNHSHHNFYPLVDKVVAFGWEVIELDGHDQKAIFEAVRNRSGKKPLFIIGKTVKGKGVSYMENVPMWHYRSPNHEEYQQALSELSE
jgi:transketolase